MNARVLFDTEENFEVLTEDTENLTDSSKEYRYIERKRKYSSELEKLYCKIKEEFNRNEENTKQLEGYLDKLKGMIHIYMALYSRYDTNLSIKMLGSYLQDFMNQLKMHIELLHENKVRAYDIAVNLTWGINYLQQFIKVVTSVNTSSFEAPKYETEKDECCIVKFPIAYAEFLRDVFKRYREKRQVWDKTTEIEHFPKYKPVVIPYMQNGENDFMMTTLFAQNMSDDWEYAKVAWENYVNNYESLMFIICQNMNKYKNVSSLIRSSFHELGHYCNGITRRERNRDIIEIFSGELAKSIIQNCAIMCGCNIQIVSGALTESVVLQKLCDHIYEQLVEHFSEQLQPYLECQSSILKEKFGNEITDLTNELVTCQNTKIFADSFNEMFNYEFNYIYDFRDSSGKPVCDIGEQNNIDIIKVTNLSENLISQIIEKCTLLKEKEMGVENSKENVDNTKEYIKIADLSEICKKSLEIIEEIKGEEKFKEYIGYINQIFNSVKDIDFKKYLFYDDEFYEEEREQIQYVCEIRQLLKNLKVCIMWTLYYQDNETANRINIIEDNYIFNQNLNDCCDIDKKREKGINEQFSELKNITDRKRILIKNIKNEYFKDAEKNYHKWCYKYKIYDEVHMKMHISAESNKSKFENMMDDALRRLKYSENTLELFGSCYEESLADMVMCSNLNLTVYQYLLDMTEICSQFYDNKYHIIPRFVIVVAYILFKDRLNKGKDEKKDFNEEDFNEEDFNEEDFNEDYTFIINNFRDAFVKEQQNFSDCRVQELAKCILDKYYEVFGNRIFKIALRRIKKSIGNMQIVELNKFENKDMENINNRIFAEELEFVKEGMKDKISDEEKKAISSKEIDFIMKYYYKNRCYYAKYNDLEE